MLFIMKKDKIVGISNNDFSSYIPFSKHFPHIGAGSLFLFFNSLCMPNNRSIHTNVFDIISGNTLGRINTMHQVYKNNGLSLKNDYWFIPVSQFFKNKQKWKDINFYQNINFPYSIRRCDLLQGRVEDISDLPSPDNTLCGTTPKFWEVQNQQIYLYKKFTDDICTVSAQIILYSLTSGRSEYTQILKLSVLSEYSPIDIL